LDKVGKFNRGSCYTHYEDKLMLVNYMNKEDNEANSEVTPRSNWATFDKENFLNFTWEV